MILYIKERVICLLSIVSVLFILGVINYSLNPTLQVAPVRALKKSQNLMVEDLNAFVLGGEEGHKFSPCDTSTLISECDSDVAKFTMLIFTFKFKRLQMVQEQLIHFSGIPECEAIYIIWSNPPGDPDTYGKHFSLPEIATPVRIFRTYKNSLNIRFAPLRVIETSAVLVLDDDVFIDHESLLLAFRIWRNNSDSLVGFKHRGIILDYENRNWKYERHPLPEQISIVLTGSTFLHRHYLWLYTYKMPKEIMNWIDRKLNCEDIAINFLVSNVTRKGPVPVLDETKIFNPWGKQAGISSRQWHYKERNDCVNYFIKVYQEPFVKETMEITANKISDNNIFSNLFKVYGRNPLQRKKNSSANSR